MQFVDSTKVETVTGRSAWRAVSKLKMSSVAMIVIDVQMI